MIEQTNNTFMRQMLADVPGSQARFERLAVKPGPWPDEWRRLTDCVFLPDDSLFSVTPVSGVIPQLGVAVLGHRSLWWSNGLQASGLQVRVIGGGHVYKVDWSSLQNEAQHYAPWLLLCAAASQRLVAQMAHLAFCARHHAMRPRLASWLLVCLHQASDRSMRIRQDDLPEAFRANEDLFQEAWATLQTHQAIRPSVTGEDSASSGPWTLEPVSLARLACTCHEHINAAASHSAQDVA